MAGSEESGRRNPPRAHTPMANDNIILHLRLRAPAAHPKPQSRTRPKPRYVAKLIVALPVVALEVVCEHALLHEHFFGGGGVAWDRERDDRLGGEGVRVLEFVVLERKGRELVRKDGERKGDRGGRKAGRRRSKRGERSRSSPRISTTGQPSPSSKQPTLQWSQAAPTATRCRAYGLPARTRTNIQRTQGAISASFHLFSARLGPEYIPSRQGPSHYKQPRGTPNLRREVSFRTSSPLR
ncbi:hypothetical protein C8F04DRAFT_1112854 [Mycena alexandri]|uniref:Uncharacterized protein n=1 Tax=Mycena alexandri TaxID=1745969 RepID=A0AAD6SQN9_9AGAR|nr:hypothetical protein C8F04DRAFT_1112854 [Mycena alexandri]